MTLKQRGYLILVMLAVFALAAFLTNPDQAAHHRAIREVVMLRGSEGKGWSDALMPHVDYRNYLVGSSTSFMDTTLSYGCFGKVQTTDGIGASLRAAKAKLPK